MTDKTTFTAPTAYTVSATATSAGQAQVHAATVSIPLDTAWPPAPSSLPGPADLLAAAFAACLIKNLQRASHLLSFRYRHAEVQVTAQRQDAPPLFVDISYQLRLDTDEPERRIDLLHYNLRRFGTVYNTLAAACHVHGEVIAQPETKQ